MNQFIDIHTHSFKKNPDSFSIIDYSIEDIGIKSEIIDFSSIGIHPWNILKIDWESELQVLDLIAENEKIIAIGECGLDRAITVNLDLQIDIFLKQVEIANKHKLPVIIHSVRAYSDFLMLLKAKHNKTPWIFHGFNGSIQTAKKIIESGGYLSFGIDLFNEKSRALSVLQQIDLQYIFLETDNSNISIIDIYEKVSGSMKIDIEDLKFIITSNFKKCFSNGD